MSLYQVGVKVLSWPACAVFGAVFVATAAAGQTLPVPAPPPEHPPDAAPTSPGIVPALPPEHPPDAAPTSPGEEAPGTEGGAAPETSRDRWEYYLGVGAGYDTNVEFRTLYGPGTWTIYPRGSLARVFTGRNGEVRLVGRGSWHSYPEHVESNRYTASLGFDGNYRPSVDTRWNGYASYQLAFSDQSPILSEQGVLLPRVNTRTAVGSLGLTQRVGLRTSLRVYGYVSRVEFDQQEAGARGLADGQSLRGVLGLDRMLGARDSAGVAYSLVATLARQQPSFVEAGRSYTLTHYGSLQWHHVLSRTTALSLEGGASYTPEAEEARLPERVSFYGGVGFNWRIRRSRLALFARRGVMPAFGLGVSRVSTRIGGRASIPLGRSWSFQIMGTHSMAQNPHGAVAFTYGTADEAYARLACRIGRHFAISGEGRYLRRGPVGVIPATDGYHVGLFLSLQGP